MRKWTFGFHQMRRNSWLAEELLASQEGLCSMELVSCLTLKIYSANRDTGGMWHELERFESKFSSSMKPGTPLSRSQLPPILSYVHPVNVLLSRFFKPKHTIKLPCRSNFPSGFFPSRFATIITSCVFHVRPIYFSLICSPQYLKRWSR